MMTHWKCLVTTSFTDDDVRDWLEVDDDYELTYQDRRDYAWHCICEEDCEYGCVEEI